MSSPLQSWSISPSCMPPCMSFFLRVQRAYWGSSNGFGASTPTGTFGVRQISHQSILLPSFFLFPVIPVRVVANRRCPMFLNKCGLLIMRCMIIFNCFKDRPYYQPTFTKFLLCVEHSAFISNSF